MNKIRLIKIKVINMFENQKNFEIENQANDLLLFEALEELKAIKKRAAELKEVIHASMEFYAGHLYELSTLLSRSNSQIDNVEVKETESIENDGIFLINYASYTKFELPISVSQKSTTDIRKFLFVNGNFTNLTYSEAYLIQKIGYIHLKMVKLKSENSEFF